MIGVPVISATGLRSMSSRLEIVLIDPHLMIIQVGKAGLTGGYGPSNRLL